MFLALKYDRMVLRLEETRAEIDIAVCTARNKRSARIFPIPPRKSEKHIIANVREIGKYLD